MKLYTDTTSYQSELRKAHWESTPKAVKSGYYHWAMTLHEAHLYHAKPIPPQKDSVQKPRQIFHGLTRLFTIDRELPLYFGPFSTTILKSVAKHFSKGEGLMFFIAPSFQNAFRFCVGINMEMLSAFKNESEFMMYNQTIPIKKTETFQEDMMPLVQHLLFSLKNRKTRINDVAAFFHKLGIQWNDEWIPIILEHKLLFHKTECKPLKVIDRLIVELDIMDQRLVDPLLDMVHHDGKPYIIYLVEALKAKQLLHHYRLMTSGFTIRKYFKEINSSYLKWEPNNKMNDVFGVTDVDDSCFDAAEYQINGQSASAQTHFLPDAVRSVTLRNPFLFGDRSIPVHGQKVEVLSADEVPHNFDELLKVDGYSNGCIFVDDIPSSDHTFRIGQEVKVNHDSIGHINRVLADSVCVKSVKDQISSFQWFVREDYSLKLTLGFSAQGNLSEYDFAIKKGQNDLSMNLRSAPKHKVESMGDFEIPCSLLLRGMAPTFIGVYVQRKNQDDYKWGRLASIKWSPRMTTVALSNFTEDAHDSIRRMISILQTTCFEIIDRGSFLDQFGLHLDRSREWAPFITKNPHIFAISRYRRRLVIERLIVELNLWSTDWIHRILKERIQDKPMLQWLVEDRRVVQLYDHYRVFFSRFQVMHCGLLDCRWLRFLRNAKMNGKAGFEDLGEECFVETKHYIDNQALPSTNATMRGQVDQISAKNIRLFGDKSIVIQDFAKDEQNKNVSHHLVDTLKMDAYSNYDIFVDKIPSKTYSFRIGQQLQSNDDSEVVITRMTDEAICIKYTKGSMYSFRWIQRKLAPKEVTLVFRNEYALDKYQFTVTVGGATPSKDLSADEMYSVSKVSQFVIPKKQTESDSVSIGIYVKPKNGDFEWVAVKTIDCSSKLDSTLKISSGAVGGHSAEAAIERLMVILIECDFTIRKSERLLDALCEKKIKDNDWMPLIAAHPLLFAVTAYRRKLVIERLIVELELWSPDWIHRVMEQRTEGKPMLEWLVEVRKLTQLYDHYRVFKSFVVRSSDFLSRRWLRFNRESTMRGQKGFEDSDESCFRMTTYEADGVPITAKTTYLMNDVHQISAKNAKLFGLRPIVLHDFGGTPEPEQFHDVLDALKVDQYSNECVFVDDIPSIDYPFCVGQQVHFDNGAQGAISRVTMDKICVKMKQHNDSIKSFKWVLRVDAPKLIKLKFRNVEEIDRFYFSVRIDESEESNSFSALELNRFHNIKDILIPCRGLSSYQFDTAAIGIYAKPRNDDYQWVRIQTIQYPPTKDRAQALPSFSNNGSSISAVNQLFEALRSTGWDIRDNEHVLHSLGLSADKNTEWMPLVGAHTQLFDVTVYRRRLVIERLIVEMKLWRTQWIHRILDEKVNNKPMLQWLVEDRRVTQLHDHYRVYISRFETQYSALLNRRWLRFERNMKMKGEPGFSPWKNTCFQFTAYYADGKSIAPNIPAVTGDVGQITIRNTQLFGDQTIVLQQFDVSNRGESSNYISDDFIDALCFGDGVVFLNHIPGISYPFCVGQEVQYTDGMTGNVCRVTANGICIKFRESAGDILFRWFKGSEIPLKLTLTFRYKRELKDYQFAVSVGRGNFRSLSSNKFAEIDQFKISCNSLDLYAGDRINIYARPKNAYKWISIKSFDSSQNFDSDDVSILERDVSNMSSNVKHLIKSLRQRASRIDDSTDALERSGLDPEESYKWLPLISRHSQLFEITAYRRTLFVERLIAEMDLLSIDMVLRIIRQTANGKTMLSWLVENRKLKRLYDHYRAYTSGFKMVFYSELLDKTWLAFEKNIKMAHIDRFMGADDSCIDKTEYTLNGVTYPMNTTVTNICVPGIARQLCRNPELFGPRDVKMEFMGRNTPILHVTAKVQEEHISRIQKVMATSKSQQIKLTLVNHRGHYGSRHPRFMLEKGVDEWYDNDGKGPNDKDWIVFEQLRPGIVPTEIVLLNHESSHALGSMKLYGSSDNALFEEWIFIQGIMKQKKSRQHFVLDPASVCYAWSRGFRYFRLCSLVVPGNSYLILYEFGIRGIKVQFNDDKVKSLSFTEALSIDKDDTIYLCKETTEELEVGWNVNLYKKNKWIEGVVSRRISDKICVQTFCDEMMSFEWMLRQDIPSKLRRCIANEAGITEHHFAAIIGHNDAGPIFCDEFNFKRGSEFAIPLHKLASTSVTPHQVAIYAKPKERDVTFQLIKTIECSKVRPTTFVVDDSFDVIHNYEIKSTIDRSVFQSTFQVFASSDIFISRTGSVSVVGADCGQSAGNASTPLCHTEYIGEPQADGGFICLISGGDVVNEGSLSCTDRGGSKHGNVYINADGIFENFGTIDCGEKGVVIIECTQYENEGMINPKPKVIYKNAKDNRLGIKQIVSQCVRKNIKLLVSSHRGNYRHSPPQNLLENGVDKRYSGEDKGPAKGDWITFGTAANERIFPTSITIRNYDGRYGLKTIKIDGSTHGKRFSEWIKIENISNKNTELQTFILDPLKGYFAWERAFTFFQVTVEENHGYSYNIFYEFWIEGVERN